MKFFTLFSKTRNKFCAPFPAPTLGDAIDEIAATIADRSNSILLVSAKDYRIYEIGTFDSDTGLFDICEPLPGFELIDFDQIQNALVYAEKLYKDAAEANAIARLRFEAEQAKVSGRQAMEEDVNG